MAPKGWAALTSRKVWFESKINAYIRAKAAGTLESWWAGTLDEFFIKYHWSLSDEEEPVTGAVYVEPGADEVDRKIEKELAMARKEMRIKVYFKNHIPKTSRPQAGKDIKEASRYSTPSLSHSGTPMPVPAPALSTAEPRGSKPKPAQVRNIYWELHKEHLQPEFVALGMKSKQIASYNTFISNAWKNESSEVQETVTGIRDARHEAAMEEWKVSGTKPLDAGLQRKEINDLPDTLSSFLHTISKKTGYAFTIIGGGPNLDQPGQMSMIEVHEGDGDSNSPIDFGSYASDLFTSNIRPEFGQYLRRIYSSNEQDPIVVELVSEPSVATDTARKPEAVPDGSPFAADGVSEASRLKLPQPNMTPAPSSPPRPDRLFASSPIQSSNPSRSNSPSALQSIQASFIGNFQASDTSAVSTATATAPVQHGKALQPAVPFPSMDPIITGILSRDSSLFTNQSDKIVANGIDASEPGKAVSGTSRKRKLTSGSSQASNQAAKRSKRDVYPTEGTPSPQPSSSTLDLAKNNLNDLLPATAPLLPWLVHHMKRLRDLKYGPEWQQVLDRWMVMENRWGSKPSRKKLKIASRPQCVDAWLEKLRHVKFTPKITSASSLGDSWWQWWRENQPKWRLEGSNGLIRNTSKSVSAVHIGGQCGMIEFIMVLAWWRGKISIEKDRQQWLEAIDEVNWVLSCHV